MANTPILALPYPVPADSVDVPRDIQALAVALDTRYGGGGAGGGGPLQAAPVLDVGLAGQIRAGRQLTVADFTALGLATPVGLFNLSGLTNLGSGGALVNKGAVPFGPGINGTAATAAVFAGSTGQALYIADTGAADPFRIGTGSFGCWMRTAKRGTAQYFLAKWASAGTSAVGSFDLGVWTSNVATYDVTNGTATAALFGVSDIADDRWHFIVATYDATAARLYVDGVLEGVLPVGSTLNPTPTGAPLNIGSFGADASVAGFSSHYGRVDEAFVTADVLSEDQVRALYCAKVAHGYATTPTRVSLNVRRRKRGGPLAAADFPTQPLRLHNFTAGALTDAGSNGVALTNNGTAVGVAGADGAPAEAFSFAGAQSLSSTDAGLPATTAARSYGCWFKTTTAAGVGVLASWGTLTAAHVNLYVNAGALTTASGVDVVAGPFVADGQWHFAVEVEDNAAGDGVRRKLYLDGRLVGGSTVLNSITLAGANRFRIGGNPDGTVLFTGQIDGAFVCGVALTFEQVAVLYAKGSQALAPSPKNVGDHVEAMDATNLLAVFDTLDSTAQVDLGVAS